MSDLRTFPNSPDVISRARGYVTQRLHDVPPEIIEIVGLMVSELATNSVRHTVSDFTVELEQTPRHIRVQVTDSGPGEPTIRSPLPSEPSGRGLRIVEDLADAFGVEYDTATEPPEKTVWFEVMLDAPGKRLGERTAQSVSGLELQGVSSQMLEADAGSSTPMSTEPSSLEGDRQPRARARLRRDRSHFVRSSYRCGSPRDRTLTVPVTAARRGVGATCAPRAATRALD